MASLPWLLDLVLFRHLTKKVQDLSSIVLAGGFQLALIGDADWLTIRIEKCRCRHAFPQASSLAIPRFTFISPMFTFTISKCASTYSRTGDS